MKRLLGLSIACLLLALAGCAQKETATPAAENVATIELSSSAFHQGEAIPEKYTCQGDDSSPALSWGAPPSATKSLALIVEDPDAPGGTWVHWVLYNLPADTRSLAETASKGYASTFNLPSGSIQGRSSFGRADYGGPCPPSGQHRYYFRLYALDVQLTQSGLDKAGLVDAMQGHIIGEGELMGVYQQP